MLQVDVVYDLGDGVLKNRTIEAEEVELRDGVVYIDGNRHTNAENFEVKLKEE